METKYEVGQHLEILPHPGWTGKVILIDIHAKRYLLDCCPGALGHYVWYKVPPSILNYPGGVLAGNWFHEDELKAIPPEDMHLWFSPEPTKPDVYNLCLSELDDCE